MIKKRTREMVRINKRNDKKPTREIIKKLTREVVQMTIIVLVMFLIASVIKFIGAGGQELIIHRAMIVATMVAIIYLIVNIIIRKRA